MSNATSRFEAVSRRAFMKRSLAAGLAASGAVALAACGNNDAEVFADAGTTGDATAATTAAGATTTNSTATTVTTLAPASTDVAAPDAPSADGTSPAGADTSGATVPASAEMVVDFTFTNTGGEGRARNPYIAVWLETEAGDMLQTISLWLMQGKGERWWNHLTRWHDQEAARVATGDAVATADTITGATRTAGDYSVSWNGTSYDGTLVPQGTYYLCIEAAREHGPYELIREPITVGAEGFSQTFAPVNELTAVAVTYTV